MRLAYTHEYLIDSDDFLVMEHVVETGYVTRSKVMPHQNFYERLLHD